MDLDRLRDVAERARERGTLPRDDVAFVRSTLPAALESFPHDPRSALGAMQLDTT